MNKYYAVPEIISTEFIVKYREPTDENPYIMINSHYHEDNYEIYFLLEHSCNETLKDRTYHLKQGDLVIIPKNIIHKSSHVKTHKHKRILVQFKESYLTGIAQKDSEVDLLACFKSEKKVLRLDYKEQEFVKNLFNKLLYEQTKKQVGWQLYNKVSLAELLLYINRVILKHANNEFDHPNSLYEKVSEIVKYLNDNFAENITLKNVSEMFYISPNYLCKIFKDVTGFTLIEYLNQIRVKQAQHLLRTEKMNVSQIFEACGFGTMTHFERIFKKVTGSSPLAYRKMHRS